MAHWAELDSNNVVTRVLVGDNNDPAGDEGYQWLLDNLGGTWVKTSYNAVGGKRRNPETGEMTNDAGFRKNYAGIGYTFDAGRDAFIPPKPFNSWNLNEDAKVQALTDKVSTLETELANTKKELSDLKQLLLSKGVI